MVWSGSTLLGHLAAGGVLSDPTAARRLGLDFVGIAVFVVVAAILFRGRRDVMPWIVAVAAALVAKWLIGGLAGGYSAPGGNCVRAMTASPETSSPSW